MAGAFRIFLGRGCRWLWLIHDVGGDRELARGVVEEYLDFPIDILVLLKGKPVDQPKLVRLLAGPVFLKAGLGHQ